VSAIMWFIVVVVHAGAIPATLFPLLYSRSTWRSTDVGRALMFKGAAVAALFDIAIVHFWWNFPGYEYLYAAVVTSVAIGVTFQLIVMLRNQRQGRRRPGGSPDGEF